MSDGGTPSVAELAEYCRTQAGLLSGRVQTIGEEADDLLDDIDADIAAMRTHISDTGSASTEAPTTPTPGGEGPDLTDRDDDLADLEAELEAKQALVEAKQARMATFQDLAAGYVELAEELDAVENWRSAFERVVTFEHDTDAPAYFEERETLLETVAESGPTDE